MSSNLTPTPKVASAGIGGALTIVLIWVLGLFGVDMPAEVAAAVTTAVSFGFGYLKSDVSSPVGEDLVGDEDEILDEDLPVNDDDLLL